MSFTRTIFSTRPASWLASLAGLLLVMSVASPALAGEPWQGTYAPDLAGQGLPQQMVQMMAAQMPQFRFGGGKVDMLVGGKLHSSSPYQMDGKVAVLDTPDGVKRATFSSDYQSFSYNEDGQKSRYLRQ